ncbi:MAG: hypothetical protein IJJ28_07295 [Lentisphaeria bacterium]|nr:hypothetical protein [Lentisphaeria bacterium]
MAAARKNRGGVKRYAKTGSFGRLNNRAVAEGSELPERYYLRRRIVWALIALAVVLPGLIALVW